MHKILRNFNTIKVKDIKYIFKKYMYNLINQQMNTIVSAFVSNVNNRYDNSLFRYYNYGKLLLQSLVPKVIFVDELMFNLIGNEYDKTNTLIIKINKKDTYLYKHAGKLSNFQLNSTDYTKDTPEFMFTMCNKTEWIKKAIGLNYFKTDNFIWVDFGIKHIFSNGCSNEAFIEKINNLKYKAYKNVRIGGIWDFNYNYNIDIYKDIAWYFAGGVFGGNKQSLIKFADLMKEKCIDIMNSKNTIMWEVNIWYLIYMKHKELFDIYKCDHNESLITNY